MNNQYEIECSRLQAQIDELEKKNRALENYKNQSYRIKNQRHEISNRLKEIEKLRDLLKECKKYIGFCCVPNGFDKSYIAEDLLTRVNAAIGESEK